MCGSDSLGRLIDLNRDPSLQTPGNVSKIISNTQLCILPLLSSSRNTAAEAITQQFLSVVSPEIRRDTTLKSLGEVWNPPADPSQLPCACLESQDLPL